MARFDEDVRAAGEAARKAAEDFAHLQAVATAAGVSLSEAARGIQNNIRAQQEYQRTLRTARDALLGVALSFKGLAAAGLAQSVEGDRLRLAFDRLTLAIGGIFKPQIDALTNTIFRLSDRVKNLTGEEQERIRT